MQLLPDPDDELVQSRRLHGVADSLGFPTFGEVFAHDLHLPLRVVFDNWYATTARSQPADCNPRGIAVVFVA
jgi:hypothetical protein